MPRASDNSFNVRLPAESAEKLKSIAEDAGLFPGRVAGLLLSELLPTVKAVRSRLQIVREEGN
jgi:hypothetical protein